MARSRIDFNGDGVTIQVDGLRRTLRALQSAGVDAEDVKALMHDIGETVADAQRALAPVGGEGDRHPGKLRDSIRAGTGKTKAVVRVGGARVPYAGVQEYGWPAHNIRAHYFMKRGLEQSRQRIFEQLDEGIAELLRRHRLS